MSSISIAFSQAWHHRWPFVLVHVIVVGLSAALIAPVVAQMIQFVVGATGQSALTDQEIALALLTPLGVLSFVVIAGFILSAAVLEVAAMMAMLSSTAASPLGAARDGLLHVASRSKRLFLFAVNLVVRVLVALTPGALIGLYLASQTMMEFDINYYLSTRPPEFLAGVAGIALVVAVTGFFLVRQLLGFAVALPAVLFSDDAVRTTFSASRTAMLGHKWPLARRLVVWLAVRLAVFAVVAFVLAIIAKLIVPGPGSQLSAVALILGALVLVGVLANGFVASICNGAFAAVLIATADQAQPGLTRVVDKPTQAVRLQGIGIAALIAVIGLVGLGLGYRSLGQLPQNDQVDIIAHRGAAGVRPENTMASFEAAIAAKADWIELDVQESADGEVVVIHDSDFMKLAKNPTKIWDARRADLDDIDIGSWFDPAYQDQRVPLLEDVLTLAKDKVNVLIELKYYGHDEMLEQRVIDLVEAHDMVDQVALMSLKYAAVQKAHALRPDWRTGVLAATAIGDLTGFDTDFLAVNTGLASRNFIARAQDKGKDVYVWTVNDPLAMAQMLSLGVNGLITDEPERARTVLEAWGDLSGAERILLALAARLGLDVDSKSYRDASP